MFLRNTSTIPWKYSKQWTTLNSNWTTLKEELLTILEKDDITQNHFLIILLRSSIIPNIYYAVIGSKRVKQIGNLLTYTMSEWINEEQTKSLRIKYRNKFYEKSV